VDSNDRHPGREMTRRGRSVSAWSEVLAPLLAFIAEGAWISVPAAFLQAAAREPAWLGPAGFSIAVAVGWLLARSAGDDPESRWASLAPVIVAVGAVLGWLASGDVVRALGTGDVGSALGRNPGGWLVGLAVLRGVAHARRGASEDALTRLASVATPGLAIPVLIGGVMPEPQRTIFLDQATLAVVLFLVCVTLALALRRMASIAERSGFDWRRNRAWLLLLTTLVVAVTLIAVPSSGTIGRVIQVAIALLFAPALIIATIASIPRVTRRMLLVLGAILVAGLVIIYALPQRPFIPDEIATGGTAGSETADNTTVYLVLGALLLAAIALLIVALVRLWMREIERHGETDVPEERFIDRGEAVVRPARRIGRPRWRPNRRDEPTTAAGAYLALLRDIEGVGGVRREAAETPSGHARRLRANGTGAIGLDLLAADYVLERWAGRALTADEDRRGVERWRMLGQRLRSAALGSGPQDAGRPATRPPGSSTGDIGPA
jgi:hypothetical protein